MKYKTTYEPNIYDSILTIYCIKIWICNENYLLQLNCELQTPFMSIPEEHKFFEYFLITKLLWIQNCDWSNCPLLSLQVSVTLSLKWQYSIISDTSLPIIIPSDLEELYTDTRVSSLRQHVFLVTSFARVINISLITSCLSPLTSATSTSEMSVHRVFQVARSWRFQLLQEESPP